jgi:transcriptional regulator with XRE-family HTH domain
VLDAEVGQSIRQHRKNAKMTLQGLADRLGIAYQQVQKYETGVNRVGAGRLMEIAEILGVPVASFFETSHGANEEAGAEADADASLQRQLIVAFARIKDPQKRKTALAYVKSLTEPDAS